jgi:hypothetical protein
MANAVARNAANVKFGVAIESPECPKCWGLMMLSRIMPEHPKFDAYV